MNVIDCYCSCLKFKHIFKMYPQISNTTIPYFLNIQTLLDNCEIKTLDYFLDEISYLINAYIQRKGEVEYVKVKFLFETKLGTIIDKNYSFVSVLYILMNIHTVYQYRITSIVIFATYLIIIFCL